MTEVINLHNWAAYRFGPEYRLIGYIAHPDNRYTCIVTEAIINVYKDTETIETSDGRMYKPLEVIDPAGKIDMMYTLDRWLNIQGRGPGAEVTHTIQESLGRVKPDAS